MPVTRRQIADVHSRVNREIRYVTDQRQYGEPDRWVANPPSLLGDCEDYALTKRARLIALGAQPADARLVLGYDWRGGRHAVLYAKDDQGVWWVLDNQSGSIREPRRHSFVPDQNAIYGEPPGVRR